MGTEFPAVRLRWVAQQSTGSSPTIFRPTKTLSLCRIFLVGNADRDTASISPQDQSHETPILRMIRQEGCTGPGEDGGQSTRLTGGCHNLLAPPIQTKYAEPACLLPATLVSLGLPVCHQRVDISISASSDRNKFFPRYTDTPDTSCSKQSPVVMLSVPLPGRIGKDGILLGQ